MNNQIKTEQENEPHNSPSLLNGGLGVWIEINLPFWDCKENDSFSGRGLNMPGVLIRMKDGAEYLIGHINELRGVCDDCTEFGSDAIVAAYQVVWTPNIGGKRVLAKIN